jgi:hypothetical protein
LQAVGMGLQELREARAAHLLLALDEEGDPQRELRVLLQQLRDRRDVRHQRPLVVGGAAPVDPVADDRRLEGRRLPEGQRVGRLHVVVAVDDDVRPGRVAAPAREDDRVDVGLHDLDLEAHGAQEVRDELLGALHPLLELRVGRDAGEADEFLQFFNGIEHPPKLQDANGACQSRTARGLLSA